MSKKGFSGKGERGIINAVERCMNLWDKLKEDKKLSIRLRLDQSVKALMKAIPEEWQDLQFTEDLYEACLELLERKGIVFPKDTRKK